MPAFFDSFIGNLVNTKSTSKGVMGNHEVMGSSDSNFYGVNSGCFQPHISQNVAT